MKIAKYLKKRRINDSEDVLLDELQQRYIIREWNKNEKVIKELSMAILMIVTEKLLNEKKRSAFANAFDENDILKKHILKIDPRG